MRPELDGGALVTVEEGVKRVAEDTMTRLRLKPAYAHGAGRVDWGKLTVHLWIQRKSEDGVILDCDDPTHGCAFDVPLHSLRDVDGVRHYFERAVPNASNFIAGTVPVTVNGVTHEIIAAALTYGDVVTLVYGNKTTDTLAVAWRRPGGGGGGMLAPGESVNVTPGLVFITQLTGNA